MVENNIKISQRMKSKGQLSIGKNIAKYGGKMFHSIAAFLAKLQENNLSDKYKKFFVFPGIIRNYFCLENLFFSDKHNNFCWEIIIFFYSSIKNGGKYKTLLHRNFFFFRVDQASGLELLFMKKYKNFLETSIFGQV